MDDGDWAKEEAKTEWIIGFYWQKQLQRQVNFDNKHSGRGADRNSNFGDQSEHRSKPDSDNVYNWLESSEPKPVINLQKLK